MIGKTISHYKILDKLGEGGMGQVYLVEDTKLKRNVAIKFLSPQLTSDREIIKRFELEAQAAASLNHPNIITIHEIGEFENQTFISMEYVNGRTLRVMIEEGNLPIDKCIDIAYQICQGLFKAHQAGIVHRDIKPENIMIDSEGQIKILDFGLAKLKSVGMLTKETSTLGTVYYMSPEQAKGEEVDHRSDIWSLGVVIYEMLYGQLPFKGEYEQAVIYSILNEEPKMGSSLNKKIPINIEQIINKSLNKDPELRYHNVNAIVDELKKPFIEAMQSKETKKSIIVLPFSNMSPDPDQEYFSDGLTEEIITDLSLIPDLLVISRSSAMTFKGTEKKTSEIAKEVNVQYILEGSVRKAGNNIRITVQLIESITDTHLWAEKYSGTLEDVFDIQEKVSRSIVDALTLKLSSEVNEKIAKKPIDNIEAYECYLRARQEFWKWDEKALDRAVQHLKNGLNIIGENTLLYAGLGFANFQYYNYGIKTNEEYLDKAVEYADKIFELEPDSPDGYRLLGFVAIFRENLQKCYDYVQRALRNNPNDSETLLLLAISMVYSGKNEETKISIDRLLKIDPLTWLNYLPLIVFHTMVGDYNAALVQSRKLYNMHPDNPYLKYLYAYYLAYNRNYEESFKKFEELEKEAKDFYIGPLSSFVKFSFKNDKENALKAVTPKLSKQCKNDLEIAWQMTECYAMINEKQSALDCLEICINRGCINYQFLNKNNPYFENIRQEVRFQNLMKRVKNEWNNFKV